MGFELRTAQINIVLILIGTIESMLVPFDRRTWFGHGCEILWLKVVVVIAFVVALVMSAPLWLASRTYPLTPVVSGLPPIVHPFDWVLYGGMLLLLAAILVVRRPQLYIWCFLAILLVLCVYDETRWQPYIYMYGFLLAALSVYSWKADDAVSRARALNIARFIIASTYIYSGLQKVNMVFVSQYFPFIVEPVTHAFPQLTTPLYYFGFVVPAIQITFGVGLLTKRFRRVAVLFAVAMHIFLLAMLGPWGLDWNSIVWPWTAAMAFFDLLLFASNDTFSARDVLWPRDSVLHWIVLVLFGVMPIFSFFNLWDSDLSAALYSGNLTEGNIYLSNIGRADLPADLQQYVTQVGPNSNELLIKDWAVGDMNIIDYPELRVYQSIAKSICADMLDPTQMFLVVNEARMFRNVPQSVYYCYQL